VFSGNSVDDMERARRDFEDVMSTSGTARTTPSSLLASSGRKGRELELQLLKSLQDDDDAVEELMMLWLCERDAAATRRLQEMEQTCSNGLVEEETYSISVHS
jgi:hypothetical protein